MSISLKDICKSYGEHSVVDHVSLEILTGELFVLLGASGSGKTTVLRMIAGLAVPDKGEILLKGERVNHVPPQQRNLGFVFQNYTPTESGRYLEAMKRKGPIAEHSPKVQK